MSAAHSIWLFLFLATFAVVWLASVAWVCLVFRFLGVLRYEIPAECARILGAVPWVWAVSFNPAAVWRIYAFVIQRRDDRFESARVSRVCDQMRLTMKVVAVGWPLVLVMMFLITQFVPRY